MNCKERRASGRFGSPASALGAGTASATVADLFASAVADHNAGAFEQAERRYRYLLTLFPNHSDSVHNLGLIALQRGDAASAIDLIAKAIKSNDRIAEYHYNIAGAFRALNRIDQVATHLERTIELRPDHAFAHLNLGNVRHLQGRTADAAACYIRALTLLPNLAAAHFNLGNVRFEQGDIELAITSYGFALTHEPNHAETHCRLGVALLRTGKAADGIAHLERSITLAPGVATGYEELAKAYAATAQFPLAAYAASRAVELKDTPQNRSLFAQYVSVTRITADPEGRFRRLLLRALAEGWARPRELASVCISLVKLNPAINECVTRADSAWPQRLAAAQLFGPGGLAALSSDKLLLQLLNCDPIPDVGFERLLTNVRHALLTAASGESDNVQQDHLEFYAAVARQCFINEYVFATTETEAAEARRLRESVASALTAGVHCPALWVAALGAYFSLSTLQHDQALLAQTWPVSIKDLLIQQVQEPAEERRLATTLPSLTDVSSEVSRLVRQQYEENPYPRWATAGPPGQPPILFHEQVKQVSDILIAGCGTGLSTIELARQAPETHILAVDLSLASLSYAKRMAQKFSVTNIEFAQADITNLHSLQRQFDFIDVSGVLHHLADPWAGWLTLLSLLRPGGAMQVGLYSQAARRNVVAARTLIAERGYQPTPEDIRRCREEIAAAGDGSLLHLLTQASDFFTTSECRDLLFHAQEHRLTIPAIRTFIEANNLQFAGFVLLPGVRQAFAQRFPEPDAVLDLGCWQAFEAAAPDTFAGMYLFSVRKPGIGPDGSTPNLN